MHLFRTLVHWEQFLEVTLTSSGCIAKAAVIWQILSVAASLHAGAANPGSAGVTSM